MSHFGILVIGDNVDDQLAPYNEGIVTAPYKTLEAEKPSQFWMYKNWVKEGKLKADGTTEELLACMQREWDDGSADEYFVEDGKLMHWSTYNPSSKWDWYVVGGCWSGWLKNKPGVAIVLGERDSFNSEPEKGGSDILTKGEVDFKGMRNDAGESAAKYWDTVHDLIDHIKAPFLTWDQMLAKHKVSTKTDAGMAHINKARAAYNAQAQIQLLRTLEAHKIIEAFNNQHDEAILATRNEYITRARANATCLFGFVRDGHWFQRGEMGWWGAVRNPKDKSEWAHEFNKMLDELPDNTILTVVDCHK